MIRVSEDIIIDVDGENYIAKVDKKKKDKKGADVTELIGYYSSLENAIKGILKHQIAKTLGDGIYALDEAVRVVNGAYKSFEKTLNDSLGGL